MEIVISKYSPKKFYKLKICNASSTKLFLKELEPVFTIWANRITQKSLSLIISGDNLENN